MAVLPRKLGEEVALQRGQDRHQHWLMDFLADKDMTNNTDVL